MNKNWLSVGLAVVAAVFATLYFSAPAPQPPVGAFPGPDILADRISLNGVGLLPHSSPLNQASTTLCSVRPRATSTLLLSRLNINTATTVAIAVEIGKSTLPDATTTRLAYRLFTASEKGVLGAVTSSSTANTQGTPETANEEDYVFSPTDYLVVKYGGARGTTNTLVGSCKDIFIEN